MPLQRYAGDTAEGHRRLWKPLEPLIAGADVAYANFEGTIQPARPQSTFPQFNYHFSLARALHDSGFDVVSTANNHAMDSGPSGVDSTLDALSAAGVATTGTRRRGDRKSPWYTIVEAKGHRIAFIAATFGTNGIPDPYGQVLNLGRDYQELKRLVRELASRKDVAGVIVTPHWGEEYHDAPTSWQRRIGRDLIDEGATAVIGSHPHVVQPMDVYTTGDGRKAVIAFSLGNFVSNQNGVEKQTGAMVRLDLDVRQGKAATAEAHYLPLKVTKNPGRRYEVDAAERAPGGSEAVSHAGRVMGTGNAMHAADRFECS
jgi:poly-gamma-glutamate synthesis protein (capsule biosynthesis protein)